MASNKHQQRRPASPATGPTISVIAESAARPAATRAPESPAGERLAMAQRRLLTAAGLSGLALMIALLAYRAFGQPAAPPPAAVAAPTAQPTAEPAPTTQPATAQPTPAAAPTPAPAATTPSTSLTCSLIADLPIYSGAVCIHQDTDVDDGVTKLKNTYTVAASADEIRRFNERSFGPNGWTVRQFTYDLSQGQRALTIEVDTDQDVNGSFTKVRLTERSATALSGSTCAPIAGLPTLPNATCIKFGLDQDDGLFEAKHTYATSASPEEIRRLYEQALAQNSWSGQKFQYDLLQGLRRMQLDIKSQLGAQGSFTEFQIEEK